MVREAFLAVRVVFPSDRVTACERLVFVDLTTILDAVKVLIRTQFEPVLSVCAVVRFLVLAQGSLYIRSYFTCSKSLEGHRVKDSDINDFFGV